jgi:phospho-N-acetylmuramoyl-pentapeptide-transferase
MGDTGSLFLGGLVTSMAFLIFNPLIILICGFVYIMEAISDIIQVGYFKLTHGKRFFKMAPIHHHFEKCGWSEIKVVTVFSLTTLVLCVLSYFFGIF